MTKVAKNSSEAISNLQSTVRYLASLDYVNSSKIASLGCCFGGGGGPSLQLAINSEPDYPLAATVVYYGNLVFDKKEVAKNKMPVLGILMTKINLFLSMKSKILEMS